MTPELARAALSFLARSDIKGAEAPILVQLAGVLEKIANSAGGHTQTGASRPKPSPHT